MACGAPRVSIGLPVYNGARHLGETLDSLLAQDCGDFELIVSDNASTDATEDICRAYSRHDRRIRYHRHAVNQGAAANYNYVYRLARGTYFKWAPHDDLYATSYLQECVAALDAPDCKAVLCYPRTLLIDEAGAVVGRHRDHHDIRGACPVERFAKLLSDGDSWCHPVVGVIRRQVLAETGLIGGYGGADHVLLAELALRGEFHEIPAPLFRRRIYAGESPSLQANRSPEEVAAWFDPRPRKCVVLPRWRLLVEHVRAVRRAPLTRLQRLACYRLLKSAPFSENWGAGLLAGEIRRALRRWCWDRHTLGALRGAQHFLPHRAWALLSGLRRGDGQRVGLAFAPPGAATHAALLGFVAECLSRRSDPESRELLSEWLNGTREPHRTAAAAAVGKREVAAEVAGTHAIMSNEPCRSV